MIQFVIECARVVCKVCKQVTIAIECDDTVRDKV